MNHYPTDEELKMISKYAMLPYLIKRLEKDIVTMKETFERSGPYVMMLQRAIDRMRQDISMIQRTFRASGIRIYDKKRTEDGVQLKYNCRGYQLEADYKWKYLQLGVDEMIGEYLEGKY
jgi:hypothetical protein